MINRLRLNNFQSHKKTDIEFSPGVNAIVGSSNSGKTAILRGLYWSIYNRPVGADFVSHWNRNKKGDPIEPSFVLVETDGGSISRIKDKNMNGYMLNNIKLEAIRTDVPEEVQKAFNLQEVNIQRQMDQPFLLCEPSGAVARFFNKIIRLDIIDRILSAAESKKRKLKQDIEIQSEIEKSTEKELSKYDWIESAQNLIGEIGRVQKRLSLDQETSNNVKELIQHYKTAQEDLSKYKFISQAEEILLNINPTIEKLSEQNAKHKKIVQLVIDYAGLNQELSILEEIVNAGSFVELIDRLLHWNFEWNERRIAIKNLIHAYEDAINTIDACELDMECLSKLMPSLCPLCNQPLKVGDI